MSKEQNSITSQNPPKAIPLEDVAGLSDLPSNQRSTRLEELGVRVVKGSSDERIIETLAHFASNETDPETREAWLAYIAASRSEAFFPILKDWLVNSDEEGRKQVVGVLAWNHAVGTNEVLLRLLRTDESEKVRRHALKFLVRRGTLGEWEPINLLPIVKDSDWRPVIKREYLQLIGKSPAG